MRRKGDAHRNVNDAEKEEESGDVCCSRVFNSAVMLV
jgi:hypothetical protein